MPTVGAHKFVFKKTRTRFKILGDRMLTSSKFHNKDPQLLGATEKNVVALLTWRPKFMHPQPKGEILHQFY